MKRSAWRLVAGALFLLFGSLIALNLLVSGPSLSGSGGLGLFMVALIPILVGFGLLASGLPGFGASKDEDSGTKRLDLIRSEIRWRAMARGGRIGPGEVASEGGHELADVERAFLAMVAEGLAVAEPDEASGIVYRLTEPSGQK